MKNKPPKIGNTQKVTEYAYNCIDTAGFFIVCSKSKVLQITDVDDVGKSDDDSIIVKLTKNINGAAKVTAERKLATKKAKEMIDDEVLN
ncbi:hypothetical protein [Klebsiella pneumoniae]|uniref:hypothetical protein n=1 Tax=Klebsiella pneumoniae TaxID=573 RepID=UPI0010108334|nr:hypothetical protein [Klebsiella pneumoniae]RXX75401.1 hypothetical protein DD589_30140 [Klebsiella pneumoniae]